ncbi:MAG TPA: hypothetical protein DCM05_11340 [Elusimicrobia bacterium]|nr:hypothetical protein [Elusimicrobiota bacterium]
MKTRLLTLSLSALLGASAVYAQETAGGRRYQPCIFPNPCGPTLAPAAKPAQKAPAQVPQIKAPIQGAAQFSPDPLQQKILEKKIQDEQDGGVVSAMRVQNEGAEKIIYQGGLRDSLKDPLALPGSKIAKKTSNAVSEPSDKDWSSVELKTASAGQINGMREARRDLKGAEADSKAGADKMWGNGRKAAAVQK